MCTWKVGFPVLHLFGRIMTYINSSCSELQGHAIKNQDLLIASGTISLKGSEGMSAVDEDVEAAVGLKFHSQLSYDLTSNFPSREAKRSRRI